MGAGKWIVARHTDRLRQVQEAYEAIKKERGMV